MRTVILGSAIDLHPGIHASLAQTPPDGFRYIVRGARHVYLHSPTRIGFSPLSDVHAGECIDFGRGTNLVHSAWWPVLNRAAWVVDLDEIPYPLLAGRTAMSAAFRRKYRGRRWKTAFAEQIGLRIRTMVEAYAHPSCLAMAFWTQYGVEHVIATFEDLGFAHLIDPLITKSYVVRPAAAALPRRAILDKWSMGGPLEVLFCGRDFDTKDGNLALRVISDLKASGAWLNFTFISSIPDRAWKQHGAVLKDIGVLDSPSRDVTLQRMAKAHVLFHPSPNESLGMVLIEAAAAGLAIVGSEGNGLAHLNELLPQNGSLRVNRNRGGSNEHERAFRSALLRLASHPALARAMGLRNHAYASSGPISMAKRNERLGRIYEQRTKVKSRTPLTIEHLVAAHRSWTTTNVSFRKLERMLLEHQERQPKQQLRIFF